MADIDPPYTSEADIGDFLSHAEEYLGRRRSCPWFKTKSVQASDGLEREVLFTFERGFLEDITARPSDYEKDIKTALKYGYVGKSNGGKNGILPLRKQDKTMLQKVSVAEADEKRLAEYGIDSKKTEGVKIVHHRPSGVRTIGIRDTTNNRILFIGQIAYKK